MVLACLTQCSDGMTMEVLVPPLIFIDAEQCREQNNDNLDINPLDTR